MININLKKQEAVRFFGNLSRIAKLLNVTAGYLSQWKDDVPELQAFKLRELARSPKYRNKKPKLECKVDIN